MIAASIACVVLKLAGYLVPASVLKKPTLARISELVPVALLAALIAMQTLGAGTGAALDARVPAVLVAVVLFALRVPFIIVVIVAAPMAAGLRALF
ncbi:AzlD domain-containing protein [Cryobacterium sp. GrIS_2_6]|uniref:AzlD domain-containing protein n=1 Tax=Cryobacterium sp. GrIS_2_6 TaxID=3162785 RepID=UPI002E0950E2|nr:branched-subunit amino acid transport protein [Cryobacterium psychrotolerans]